MYKRNSILNYNARGRFFNGMFRIRIIIIFSPIVCESAITAVHKTKASIFFYRFFLVIFCLLTSAGLFRRREQFFFFKWLCVHLGFCVREHSADFSLHTVTFHRQQFSLLVIKIDFQVDINY